jgi:hypothetical protein
LKVASESFTVVPHPADGEISLLIGGLKIVLDLDEARALTAQLISGMKAICRVERVGDRIARSNPDLAVVDAPVGALAAQPAAGALAPQPAMALAGAEAGPASSAPAFSSLKEAVAKEMPGRGEGKPEASSAMPAPIGKPSVAAAPQAAADETAEERDKKSGKKLRSLFKALVKEDDSSSFSGGL